MRIEEITYENNELLGWFTVCDNLGDVQKDFIELQPPLRFEHLNGMTIIFEMFNQEDVGLINFILKSYNLILKK